MINTFGSSQVFTISYKLSNHDTESHRCCDIIVMDPLFVRPTSLMEDHIATLSAIGITSEKDLLLYDESVLNQIFPNANDRTPRRKLEAVILYKNSGSEWSNDLTPRDIIAKNIQTTYYGSNPTYSTTFWCKIFCNSASRVHRQPEGFRKLEG